MDAGSKNRDIRKQLFEYALWIIDLPCVEEIQIQYISEDELVGVALLLLG